MSQLAAPQSMSDVRELAENGAGEQLIVMLEHLSGIRARCDIALTSTEHH